VRVERFIAQRIVFSNAGKKQLSRPVIRIATIGVALGFTVMVLAISVVSGFKKEIREKLIGFNAHIQVSRFDLNFSYETTPIKITAEQYASLRALPEVRHVQRYATKAGILKKGTAIQGIVAKGISSDYDWSFFQKHLIAGKLFRSATINNTNEIIVSQELARKMELSVGDSIVMYFIQQPPRARKFKICGIYETGFAEFDQLYLFCDLGQLQKLNDWKGNEIGGVEIFLHDYSALETTNAKVYEMIDTDLNARTITENYPQLFDWLDLQDINAIIIIVLMIIVSGINMIATLLVILLERVNMIGTFKSMGATDARIRNVFLWVAFYIIGRGLLIGNVVGLGLVFLQQQFHFLPLDQASYYISYVPVSLSIPHLLLLNLGTLLACVSLMIFPALMIGSVRPVQALRYS
jgi:lipoprotein-releasing system permease protein